MRAAAYASVTDLHRHLTFLPSLTATSKPTASEAHGQLLAASDELDGALAVADYTVPVGTGATLSAGVLQEWASLGGAAKVALSLPQGHDSKHLPELADRFAAILTGLQEGDLTLPDAALDPSVSGARFGARSPADASPLFTRDSMDDR